MVAMAMLDGVKSGWVLPILAGNNKQLFNLFKVNNVFKVVESPLKGVGKASAVEIKT